MQALSLGLLAALLWGLHDFTVRRVSVRADAAALYLVVLAFGVLLVAPLSLLMGDWSTMTVEVLVLSSATGWVYAVGVYALYRAFAIGPVRLVAPICGAYPVISVAIAVVQGQATGALVWLALMAVLAGITLVAQGESGAANGSRSRAVAWSVLAALGFAASFWMLHRAAQQASDLPVTLIARIAGLVGLAAWVLSQRIQVKPAWAIWPTLLLMGALDVGGMVAIAAAGHFAHPEFAAVASSCFGLVTILLAWRFLGETLTRVQCLGAVSVFAGIVILGLA